MKLKFIDSNEEDFDALVELRIEAMRESLEKVGRFDRQRSIERFRASFVAAETTKIIREDVLIGFYSVAIKADHLHLGHLYVRPDAQSLGIGSFAMKELVKLSNETELPIRLGALKESRSNDFYQRYGFVKTNEDEWDIYYERSLNNEHAVDR